MEHMPSNSELTERTHCFKSEVLHEMVHTLQGKYILSCGSHETLHSLLYRGSNIYMYNIYIYMDFRTPHAIFFYMDFFLLENQ